MSDLMETNFPRMLPGDRVKSVRSTCSHTSCMMDDWISDLLFSLSPAACVKSTLTRAFFPFDGWNVLGGSAFSWGGSKIFDWNSCSFRERPRGLPLTHSLYILWSEQVMATHNRGFSRYAPEKKNRSMIVRVPTTFEQWPGLSIGTTYYRRSAVDIPRV